MTDYADEASKKRDIAKLIEISGAKQIALQTFNYAIQGYKETDPEVYEILESEINVDDMLDEIYSSIYEKHFSDSEIKELIRFYESPIGKKLLNLSPRIFQDAAIMAENYIKEKLEKYQD